MSSAANYPFILTRRVELSAGMVCPPRSEARRLVEAEALAARCALTIATRNTLGEPTLPGGLLLRLVLDRLDFLWLDGGELKTDTPLLALVGAANALDVPVFAPSPVDATPLTVTVRVVPSLTAAAKEMRATEAPNTPHGSLRQLQRHYARMAAIRGYDASSPQNTLLLMTEELGELAHALRKTLKLGRHHLARNIVISEELADVQLYLLHLANITGVDLGDAVDRKERVNHERWLTAHGRRTHDTPPYLAIEGIIGVS